MRCFCLLFTCICLCGCFLQPPQAPQERLSQPPPAAIQIQVIEKQEKAPNKPDLKDNAQDQQNVGWPVTVAICSLFLLMPLLAHRRIK